MPTTVPLNRNGMTARMILQATPRETHLRANNVYIYAWKAMPNEGGGVKYIATARTTRNDDGTSRPKSQTYRVTIIVLNSSGHVNVDCECKAHPFWGGEVALHKRKAADIRRSNGKLPMVRNPKLQPYGCKHMLAAIWKLQTAGKLR